MIVKLARYFLFTSADILRSIPFLLFYVISKKVLSLDFTPQKIAGCFIKLFLWKRPDKNEIEWIANQLEAKKISPLTLCLSFFIMPQWLEQKLFGINGNEAHHKARVHLLSKILPQASVVLDLGGASTASPEGALIGMGYPYKPDKITILDLPPTQRMPDQLSLYAEETSLQYGKTCVTYVFGSMDDLSSILDHSVDLVWSGQSIEHITEYQAKNLFLEIKRVLRQNGLFCLDTPNRHISKLLCRTGFLHPEHKLEYTPQQLVHLLEEAQFKMVDQKAISPLPYSLRWNRFCKLELHQCDWTGHKPNEGFSFYLACKV